MMMVHMGLGFRVVQGYKGSISTQGLFFRVVYRGSARGP